MRAITGAIISSKPRSLDKAYRILVSFLNIAASHLPSSDCATYLAATAEATYDHHLFRRSLRANRQQGATDLDARGCEVLLEGERNQQDSERNEGIEVPAGGSHSFAEEAELAVAAGKKKSKKWKEKEDHHDDITVPGVFSQSPASPKIATEKRKKEKNSNKDIARAVKQEPGLVAMEELGSEKKSKKKKEKDRVKLEEDLGEVKEQLVNNGAAEQGIASGEKKRKKTKHAEEEGQENDAKEEKMDIDGDLVETKRKKKRGRGGDDDNDQEQEEHTKKKQKKQS